MKKAVLSTAIAGALLAASSAASAQHAGLLDLSPDLTLPEKGTFSCIEQSLSLVAALIDRQGCAATEGSYTLGGDINYNGDGYCTVDDRRIEVETAQDTMRGTAQLTYTDGEGEIDDVDFFDLNGSFWYSGEGEIMYADAYFKLCLVNCGPGFPGAEDYDEHVIKDFFGGFNSILDAPIDNEVEVRLLDRIVLDQGLEVITKNNWPRKKYRQSSVYLAPNGGIGVLVIGKISIAPSNAPQCILAYDALVDDFGGGIQFSGNLDVMPLAPP